jgi:hypothetical protein
MGLRPENGTRNSLQPGRKWVRGDLREEIMTAIAAPLQSFPQCGQIVANVESNA